MDPPESLRPLRVSPGPAVQGTEPPLGGPFLPNDSVRSSWRAPSILPHRTNLRGPRGRTETRIDELAGLCTDVPRHKSRLHFTKTSNAKEGTGHAWFTSVAVCVPAGSRCCPGTPAQRVSANERICRHRSPSHRPYRLGRITCSPAPTISRRWPRAITRTTAPRLRQP